MKAVIQAGGMGTRLRPYTLVLPKPLMPVVGLPVIEILIKWLRRNGVTETYITTGYLGHLLRSILGDGSQWGLNINYTEETEPLGTVGALHLMKEHLDEPFLMLNGDLITDINVRNLMENHKNNDGLVTVATTTKTVDVDLGVIESKDNKIISFREKPSMDFTVSMGIYCMDPQVLELIPPGLPFGFDDLVFAMLDKGLPVYTSPHQGCWLDIGRPEDFQRAQEEFKDSQSYILGI